MGIHGPSDYLRPNYVTQNSAGDDVLVTNSNKGSEKYRIQSN